MNPDGLGMGQQYGERQRYNLILLLMIQEIIQIINHSISYILQMKNTLYGSLVILQ
jgi:hypothetical protein